MKLKFRIFLLIASGIMMIVLVFGTMQVKFEGRRLMNELRLKASSVAEMAEISSEILISENLSGKLNEIMEIFETKNRTQGCVIYDGNARVISESRTFKNTSSLDVASVKKVLETKTPEYFEGFDGRFRVLKYIDPIINKNKLLGAVEVIYDTSFIDTSVMDLWKRLGILAVIFILLMSMFAFDFIERTFFYPEKRTKEMIAKLKNARVTGKYELLNDFRNLMENYEDASFMKIFIDEKSRLKNYKYYKDIAAPVVESEDDMCLAIIDIDNFKQINTLYGHDKGDEVIRAVSDILSRHTDSACRYGGEEFVFISKSDVEFFTKLCNQIRTEIESHAATAAGLNIPVTVSIGAAISSEAESVYKGERERAVFRIADKRLMRAKQDGRNRVVSAG
jgi:diguanylate cyclase (GGDEF)-like protein